MHAMTLHRQPARCPVARGGRVPVGVCRAASAPTAAPPAVDAAAFEAFLLDTQKRILTNAERLDGSGQKFATDRWERPGDNAGGLMVVGRVTDLRCVVI